MQNINTVLFRGDIRMKVLDVLLEKKHIPKKTKTKKRKFKNMYKSSTGPVGGFGGWYWSSESSDGGEGGAGE
jgi:hypothetical protein